MKSIELMLSNGMLRLIIVFFTGCYFIGCATIMDHNNIIKVGMTKAEVNQICHCHCLTEEFFMSSAGQLDQGCRIFKNGNEFILIFDKGERIIKITTSCIMFSLHNGISVGSTFADIKKLYNKYNILIHRGYGRLAIIADEGLTFGFSWIPNIQEDSIVIHDMEKVKWIEFKEIKF